MSRNSGKGISSSLRKKGRKKCCRGNIRKDITWFSVQLETWLSSLFISVVSITSLTSGWSLLPRNRDSIPWQKTGQTGNTASLQAVHLLWVKKQSDLQFFAANVQLDLWPLSLLLSVEGQYTREVPLWNWSTPKKNAQRHNETFTLTMPSCDSLDPEIVIFRDEQTFPETLWQRLIKYQLSRKCYRTFNCVSISQSNYRVSGLSVIFIIETPDWLLYIC